MSATDSLVDEVRALRARVAELDAVHAAEIDVLEAEILAQLTELTEARAGIAKLEAHATAAMASVERGDALLAACGLDLTETRDGVAELGRMLGEAQAERDEAHLEIAAWQGEPGGGLPGWEWLATGVYSRKDGTDLMMVAGCRWKHWDDGSGPPHPQRASSIEGSPRAAMRAAEVAAGLREAP